MKYKYVTTEEIRSIVQNKINGQYILTYWNLDYGYSRPEAFCGNLIEVDGEYNMTDDVIYFCLVSGGKASREFPIDFRYDTGAICTFNNDHYAFTLKKII